MSTGQPMIQQPMNTQVAPEQVQSQPMNQPMQESPDNGASVMGVNPSSIQQPAPQQPPQNQNFLGTPYQTPEQLAEGYRNLQAQSTQVNQRYAELQQNWNTLLQHMSTQQAQTPQAAQPTPQSILELSDEAFTDALNSKPKEHLMQLAEEVALRKLQPTIDNLQKQLQASQTILNQQMLDKTMSNMQATYGSLDPNYNANLNAAVEMVLGPLRASAETDPAGTLNMAYEMVLGRQMKDPNFVGQLQQSAVLRQQQVEAQKQMAGVTTSQTQALQPTYQPYNPQPQQLNGMPSPQQLARQIALHGDPSLASGLGNLQVGYNPF